jgi:hypothetical protein
MSTEILSDLKNILSWALRRLKQKDWEFQVSLTTKLHPVSKY